MKRIVFCFPFAIVTFLIGMAVFALSISGIDPLPAFEMPDIARAERPQPEATAYANSCEEEMIKEVYAAILAHEEPANRLIVVEEFTNRGGTIMGGAIAKREIEGVQPSTMASYELRNRERRSLLDVLAYQKNLVIYVENDEQALSSQPGGFDERFEKRFPGAQRLHSLSNVGFDADYTEALVYTSYFCGSLCGGGSFVVLRKVHGQWIVDHEIPQWVS